MMGLFDTITKAFRSIPDIGVRPELRPEEAKHIRYLNIGFALCALINLAFAIQGLTHPNIPPIMFLGQFMLAILTLPVFIFNAHGRYTAARVYGFLLFYASTLFFFPLSGKGVVDHYLWFTAVGYAFLVFPRREKVTKNFDFDCINHSKIDKANPQTPWLFRVGCISLVVQFIGSLWSTAIVPCRVCACPPRYSRPLPGKTQRMATKSQNCTGREPKVRWTRAPGNPKSGTGRGGRGAGLLMPWAKRRRPELSGFQFLLSRILF